jgi:hypothetical protein
MQGAKAYVLPLVAGLVLLGYWLLAPDVEDTAAPAAPSPSAPATPAPPNERTKTLASIQEALGDRAGELPEEYRTRQSGIVRAALAGCKAPEPIPFRITLVGAPGIGGAVESVEPTGDVPASMQTCVTQALKALPLAAPPKAGRSILEL